MPDLAGGAGSRDLRTGQDPERDRGSRTIRTCPGPLLLASYIAASARSMTSTGRRPVPSSTTHSPTLALTGTAGSKSVDASSTTAARLAAHLARSGFLTYNPQMPKHHPLGSG